MDKFKNARFIVGQNGKDFCSQHLGGRITKL